MLTFSKNNYITDMATHHCNVIRGLAPLYWDQSSYPAEELTVSSRATLLL